MLKVKYVLRYIVPDIYETASKDRMLKIISDKNSYGNTKEIITLNESEILPLFILNSFEKTILDKVIEETKNLNWIEFIILSIILIL